MLSCGSILNTTMLVTATRPVFSNFDRVIKKYDILFELINTDEEGNQSNIHPKVSESSLIKLSFVIDYVILLFLLFRLSEILAPSTQVGGQFILYPVIDRINKILTRFLCYCSRRRYRPLRRWTHGRPSCREHRRSHFKLSHRREFQQTKIQRPLLLRIRRTAKLFHRWYFLIN